MQILKNSGCTSEASVNDHVQETPPCFQMTGIKEIPFYVGCRMIR